MRVLGVGSYCDLGALYQRLVERGHEVRVRASEASSADVFRGMLVRSDASWEDDVAWVRADPRGLVLFEGVGKGELQDELRASGLRVVGGSAYGDRLEIDRAFGQRTLGELGLPIAPSVEALGFDEALAYVERHPARYVLKFSGVGFASTRSYVGVLDDGADMRAMIEVQRDLWAYPDEVPRVVLMKHLRGIEIGVGAFFDGDAFSSPPNVDWEHKRFFPGDLGELTGEMGTVVAYRGAEKLFDATLALLAPRLRDARHVGYVNLNLIVNDEGTWPLELTCRFGYPGFAILDALHAEPWDVLLDRLAGGSVGSVATHAGFSVGVVLTVPSFPYYDGYARLSKGMPIVLRSDLDAHDRTHLHYGEVGLRDGRLVTAGEVGYVMVVTGRGDDVASARADAYRRVEKVVVPNVRYRNDIGESLQRSGLSELARMGWYGSGRLLSP